MLLFASPSLAAAPTVSVAVSGEAVLGGAINTRFRGSSIGGQVQGAMPYGPLDLRLTLGYRRLGGTVMSEYLWYSPVDLTVGLRLPVGRSTLFVHAGPSLVVWGATPNDKASSGGNWGAVGELGVIVPTRIYQAPLYDTDPLLSGIDLVVTAGGRWSDVHDKALKHDAQCGTSCGLDFSAIRLNAGLAIRF
jgi:hypothetical protein